MNFIRQSNILHSSPNALTNLTQYDSLYNHCPAFAPMHSVVPMCSVLGPILFAIYI